MWLKLLKYLKKVLLLRRIARKEFETLGISEIEANTWFQTVKRGRDLRRVRIAYATECQR